VRVDCFIIVEKGKNTPLYYGANNSTITKGVQSAGSVRESKGVLILLQLERGKWKYIYSRKKCNNPLSHYAVAEHACVRSDMFCSLLANGLGLGGSKKGFQELDGTKMPFEC